MQLSENYPLVRLASAIDENDDITVVKDLLKATLSNATYKKDSDLLELTKTIDSVNSMLSGLESLEVHMDKLQEVMTSWGPCTPDDFKQKLAQWVDSQTSGKDKSKVRIAIK